MYIYIYMYVYMWFWHYSSLSFLSVCVFFSQFFFSFYRMLFLCLGLPLVLLALPRLSKGIPHEQAHTSVIELHTPTVFAYSLPSLWPLPLESSKIFSSVSYRWQLSTYLFIVFFSRSKRTSENKGWGKKKWGHILVFGAVVII